MLTREQMWTTFDNLKESYPESTKKDFFEVQNAMNDLETEECPCCVMEEWFNENGYNNSDDQEIPF